MSHAFVAGASGFIGPHLIRALVSQGWQVSGLVRHEAGASIVEAAGGNAVRGDLVQGPDLSGALADCDAVFNLAAPRHKIDPASGRSSGRKDPEGLVTAAGNLARATLGSSKARYVLASSVAVYGPISRRTDEAAPLRPSGPYAAARIEAERITREVFSAEPERAVIARLTEVFGAGDRTHRALLEAIAAGRFRMIGNGRAIHHISAVQDVVAMLIACATVPAAGGRTLNIGSPPVSFATFTAAAARAARQPARHTAYLEPIARATHTAMRRAPLLRRALPGLSAALDYQMKSSEYDISAATACLGPQNPISLDRALELTLEDYLRTGSADAGVTAARGERDTASAM